MTDQKHTKEPSVLKQIINTLMDYINKIECQRDELREALQFWLPNSIPFPDPDNDEACKRCNKRWEEHLTLLAKTKESV